MSVNAIAGAGLIQALRRFDATAQRVARAGEPAADVDLAEEAVEQITESQDVASNLVSLRTADETLKRVLDLKV